MTPGARVQAAIELMDAIAAGRPAEAALTGWARGSRFAGSGDRAAVRDHVFAALRRWRSSAALGGAETGRGRMLGLLRTQGIDPATLFTGQGHAPAPPDAAELAHLAAPPDLPELVALDCPDWLAPQLRESLGEMFAPVMAALQERAPVFLRAHAGRGGRDAARAALAADGIETRDHPLAATALEVTANARALRACRAYADGLVELQDAASQAVIAALPQLGGLRVLDYCAGGGGKALAMAAQGAARVLAHDAAPARMSDLPARAARAGAGITLCDTAEVEQGAPYDLVLLDVPCSGSGSWRRTPEGKWSLTPARLAALCRTQADILDTGAALVARGGWLAYVTCSMLQAENDDQIAAFIARTPGWQVQRSLRLTPLDGGDGFFMSLLTRQIPA